MGRKGQPRPGLRWWAPQPSAPSLTACFPSAEIEAIKLAEQKRKAEQRRRATVVVGDLQPLRDALPELLELEAGARRPHARG